MSMTQDQAKRQAAAAALQYVVPGSLLGVGTGSTVNHFIDLLAERGIPIAAAVSSSQASTQRLLGHGYRVIELNEVDGLSLYVDGADESNARLELIKGGGAALTREKIIAAAAETFLCIADDSKLVPTLGCFPLPVEVIGMATALVNRELRKLGGEPRLRSGVITDNGHPIIDVLGLAITQPRELETAISLIPGVVTVGLFAHRPADLLILGGANGVRELKAST